ncbi:hypothetical protein BRE01_38050 [Brevibacillus reuszeri]|uniref:Fibronectin type-III domain-containing protein n=1 Tax=Brevibacillus reuszeri TaxID=54915 RepID=A0A0K9YW10_9BACL|nr:hypothetical protein [Brevibacillus reuszeri]KNB72851.1 hypothetical protein ADS79_13525 [Brevibacillus reuszeri]MED1860437.1 hypothetical protein [Brevibacillus reuszeri]GED70103.1 hypothetical protein BRE01_38050 [Brevibacillus reuszeri]
MKKFVTALATLALLTTATPTFAQEGQTTQSKSLSNSSTTSNDEEFQDIEVRFGYVSGADRYKWVRYNVTDGYEDASGTSYSTSSKIYSLRVGKLYRIHAYAVDQNNNVLAVSNPVEVRGERGETVIFLNFR